MNKFVRNLSQVCYKLKSSLLQTEPQFRLFRTLRLVELPKIVFCFAKDFSSKRGREPLAERRCLEVELFLEDRHGGE
jgi:hypothetical protein